MNRGGMSGMGQRVVVVSAERYAQEKLVGNAELRLPGVPAGERIVLVAGTTPPVVFGLARAVRDGIVRYTRRLFDSPLPADGLAEGPLADESYAALVERAGPAGPVRTWLVGVDLPVEAESPAEAVRRYWSYLRDLGPTELPAYVAPVEDELAMQAYLVGEPAPLDPEED
jgi:hypothetical protein